MIYRALLLLGLSGSNVFAHLNSMESQTVLMDLSSAQAVSGRILEQDTVLNLAVTQLTSAQINKLSDYNHTQNKCAGFEALPPDEARNPAEVLSQMRKSQEAMVTLSPLDFRTQVTYDAKLAGLVAQTNPQTLKDTVTWLSSYHNRYHKSKTQNKHVEDLKVKLSEWLKGAPWPYTIEMIAHTSTSQNTLKLTIPGTVRPNEIIILGGHLDSINKLAAIPFIGKDRAPGADDNASGSSNLIEALKLLKQIPEFERTVEFYWYAGEEAGLLGSGEVAKASKSKNRNVIGVLQLDMTLFPGDGEQVISLVDDFTSPWLNSFVTDLNDVYIKARLVHNKCGYACSDHASWNKQGYHAVMPSESDIKTMNPNIHSENDVINLQSNFNHSNSYTKIALLFAAILGNSTIKAP